MIGFSNVNSPKIDITKKTSITIATTDWSNNSYSITDSHINTNSIVDIYYSQESKTVIASSSPSYSISGNTLTIRVSVVPTSNIVIDCIRIENV